MTENSLPEKQGHESDRLPFDNECLLGDLCHAEILLEHHVNAPGATCEDYVYAFGVPTVPLMDMAVLDAGFAPLQRLDENVATRVRTQMPNLVRYQMALQAIKFLKGEWNDSFRDWVVSARDYYVWRTTAPV